MSNYHTVDDKDCLMEQTMEIDLRLQDIARRNFNVMTTFLHLAEH